MSVVVTGGMVLDMLAHWQYRMTSLYRDLQAEKSAVHDAKNPHRRTSFEVEFFAQDVEDMEANVVLLQWLYAEAEYWCIRLDLEARYTHQADLAAKVDEHLNAIATQAWSRGGTWVGPTG